MKNWMLVFGAKLKKITMKKAAAFTVTRMNIALMTSLTNAVGKEQAMEIIFNQAAEMGHEFMLELHSTMPSSLDYSQGIGRAAWLTFTGKEPSETTYEEIEMREYKGSILKIRDDQCTFCEGVSFEGSFCTFPVGAFAFVFKTRAALS